MIPFREYYKPEKKSTGSRVVLERIVILLFCRILGRHDYFIAQKFSKWSRRVGCYRCRKTFGMNDDTKSFLPWDDDFENLFRDLGHRIKIPDFIKSR